MDDFVRTIRDEDEVAGVGAGDGEDSEPEVQFGGFDPSELNSGDEEELGWGGGAESATGGGAGDAREAVKVGGWSFRSAIANAKATEAPQGELTESLAEKVARKRTERTLRASKRKTREDDEGAEESEDESEDESEGEAAGESGDDSDGESEEESPESGDASGDESGDESGTDEEAAERDAAFNAAEESASGSAGESDSDSDDQDEDDDDASDDGDAVSASGSDTGSASGSGSGSGGSGSGSGSDDDAESDADDASDPASDAKDEPAGGDGEDEDEDAEMAEDVTRDLVARGEATAARAKKKFFSVDPFAAAEPGADASEVMSEPTSWAEMHLSRPLMRAVSDLKYKTPTPIQRRTVPLGMAGRDICGSAETGSGKTAAFLLPVLERLMYRDKRTAAIRCLIVSPTRELATQIWSMMKELNKYADIRTCLVVGGLSLKAQEADLRGRPDVVICTPGRMIDHLRNSISVHLDDVEMLVMDEADRLLELGFVDEVQELVKSCPRSRQTLLFSATMTEEVDQLAKLSLNKPVRVSADPLFDLSKRLVQEFVRVRDDRESDREAILCSLVTRQFSKGTIVFFRRKKRAHRAAILLGLAGANVGELHGNLTQRQRLEALEGFRTGALHVLVATDLAGRGLDIDGVKHVINFEMPNDMRAYVHRVGRTARAGRGGLSITLVGEKGRGIMRQVVKHAKGNLKARQVAPSAIKKWRDRIESMEADVDDIMKQEQLEKEVRVAEMEANKAKNMMEHEAEITSRPARTWFQSAQQKADTKKAALESMMGRDTPQARASQAKAAELAKLSAKERKAQRLEELRARRAEMKAESKKVPHRLTRAKRRRLALEEEDARLERAARKASKHDDDDFDDSAVKQLHKAKHAIDAQPMKAKKAKAEARKVAVETGTALSSSTIKKEKERSKKKKRKEQLKQQRRAAEASGGSGGGGGAFDVDLNDPGMAAAKRANVRGTGVSDAIDGARSAARDPGTAKSKFQFKERDVRTLRKGGKPGRKAFKSQKKYKRR